MELTGTFFTAFFGITAAITLVGWISTSLHAVWTKEQDGLMESFVFWIFSGAGMAVAAWIAMPTALVIEGVR